MTNDVQSILSSILNDEELPENDETNEESEQEITESVTPASIAPPEIEPQAEFTMDQILADLSDLGFGGREVEVPDTPKPPVPMPAVEEPLEEVSSSDDEEVSLADLLSSTAEEQPDEQTIFKDAPAATPEKLIPMPVFTTDEIADTLDIRNFATLVTLNTARWHGKVKDRLASSAAAQATGADPLAFETQKRLLAGADEKLKKVHKTIDDARTRHYQMTLPWSTMGRNDQGKRMGGRLLPHTMFNEYIATMSKAKNEMDKALAEFTNDYGGAVNRAKQSLGTRFDPTEYPNPSSIQHHFGLSFDFHPIPIGDDFKGLADQQIAKLANTLARKNRTMLENAMQETWTRTYELVEQAADRFNTPGALFHYTLIDKLRDAAANLKNLNVTGDKCIEQVRQAIAKHLTMNEAEDIRGDEALRKRLGKIASACLKEMQQHGTKA